jgi:diguanylate cyclase (GGDEF)-like protein/PAS domain S-box-containing protein
MAKPTGVEPNAAMVQSALAEESALISSIIDSSPIGIAVIDLGGCYVSVNPAYAHLYGYVRTAMLGQSFTMVFAPAQRQQALELHQAFLLNAAHFPEAWQVFRCDGSQRNIMAESVAIHSATTGKLRLVYVVDITPLKIAEQKLQQSEAHFRTLASVLPVGIFRTDPQGHCIYVNERWCAIAGISATQATGSGWAAAIHPDDCERVVSSWYTCASQRIKFSQEYRFQRLDGSTCWVLGQAQEELGLTGEVIGYVGSITDITEHKRLETELRQLATTDFLTGLYNRRWFISRIEETIAHLQRTAEYPMALLMLDLDHFKEVNDNFGHVAGDALLKHFAELLSAAMRRGDIAGRLGGEVFAIILPGANLAAATQFAERFCEQIARSPLHYLEHTITQTVSIGVYEIKPTDGDPDTLLGAADKALYRAKAQGRNCVVAI